MIRYLWLVVMGLAAWVVLGIVCNDPAPPRPIQLGWELPESPPGEGPIITVEQFNAVLEEVGVPPISEMGIIQIENRSDLAAIIEEIIERDERGELGTPGQPTAERR